MHLPRAIRYHFSNGGRWADVAGHGQPLVILLRAWKKGHQMIFNEPIEQFDIVVWDLEMAHCVYVIHCSGSY